MDDGTLGADVKHRADTITAPSGIPLVRDAARIAAEASALPHLRVALDAATQDDRATLETALAEVTEEQRDTA